ncbi:phosphotransferase family protein [Phytomonospora endophytica]|uniref:Aminoglycoside phosphotransferase (APT) family kinase protein n=1 Tax=Phytomonospora endophytica TaxID=714109 RepID=A0A841FNJ9_9ACTN|nr:aminoglycoside phosphotransferase family protein [Phytomonospora endophytica]MBB6037645.1 aminoglycoside phosphotransferase (APT) family kinase protein [Phytomonospora endophytica]GIG67828.1 hypothetical protein Pen01_41230 [Phytomonospora endophytica]
MLTTSPSPAALRWAAATAGPDALVTGVRELGGGMHAATHLITTSHPTLELVLRRFEPGDDAAARETRTLTPLNGLDGFAPTLLASDPLGEFFGEPAVLISKLPGTGNITPADPFDWACQLARGLARIHAIPTPAGWDNRFTISKPPEHPHVLTQWDRMQALPLVTSHVDYWSGNTVWTGEQLSGVVDWAAAALAPRQYDLAWTRDDMILLYETPEVADAFLAEYQSATDTEIPDMHVWDLWTASRTIGDVHTWSKGYVDFGRADLTGPELTRRKTNWLAHLEARI